MIYFADTRTADDGEKIPAPIATRSMQPGSLWRFKKPASEICEIRWRLVSKSGIDFKFPPNCQIEFDRKILAENGTFRPLQLE